VEALAHIAHPDAVSAVPDMSTRVR
jgi:hypothetical protein